MLPPVTHPWSNAHRTSGSTRLPPPLPSFISQPSLPSAQVAERTAAVGCSLTSPTHGQRSSELPQRATAPLAERGHSRVYVCVLLLFLLFFGLFVFFILPSFGTPHTRIYFSPPLPPVCAERKRAESAATNAPPCSSSRPAARCCPSTTRRSSSSSPAAATCTFFPRYSPLFFCQQHVTATLRAQLRTKRRLNAGVRFKERTESVARIDR